MFRNIGGKFRGLISRHGVGRGVGNVICGRAVFVIGSLAHRGRLLHVPVSFVKPISLTYTPVTGSAHRCPAGPHHACFLQDFLIGLIEGPHVYVSILSELWHSSNKR